MQSGSGWSLRRGIFLYWLYQRTQIEYILVNCLHSNALIFYLILQYLNLLCRSMLFGMIAKRLLDESKINFMLLKIDDEQTY